MKMNTKGVSPVIATILLIALTVAAVGIVAVVLSGMGTPVTPPSTMVTFGQYGYFNTDNGTVIRYRVNTTGGDTISRANTRITFVAKIADKNGPDTWTRDQSTLEVKGTIANLNAANGTITWDTAPSSYAATPAYTNTDYQVYFFPGLESGKTSELMIAYGAVVDNYLDITSISIVDIPSSSVIYSSTNVPAPQALG